jgi:hypothetical protein
MSMTLQAPPATLYGELTTDGKTIVLMGTGPDYAVAQMAARIQLMTPLVKPSDPAGALVLPATWAAVVQLSHLFGPMWRPGPRLTEWLMAETLLRAPSGGELAYELPEGLTPRPYQVDGALMIGALGRALLFDDPGCIYGDAVMAINRNGKGFSIKLRDLVARFNGTGNYPGAQWDRSKPTFVQREVDGVVRLGRIINAWSSGIKQTYTVTTETGRTVRATDEHPFLTERGWVRLDDLQAGDLVHVRGTQKTTGRMVKQRYREVAGLRAHPYARGANRKTSPYRVAHHRLVAEARLNDMDVDTFIEHIRAGHTVYKTFLDPAEVAVHHVDLNPANNAPDNLQVVTHAEHHRMHAGFGKTAHVLYKVATERVVSVVPYGREQTFDIEVADDPHNFLADGFVVHNTGKTITTILGLLQRAAAGHEVTPVVVIAPASVVDPWVEAVQTWAPHWRVNAWRGSPQHRRRLADRPSGTEAHVVVASYDTARMDAAKNAPLARLGARSVVVDECHLIKSPHAARSVAARRLAKRADNFVALSGTPITHHPGDLWPTLEALAPLAWPSGERWKARYCETIPGDYSAKVIGLNTATDAEMRMTLLGQHRRVAKADVLAQLPPKVYSVRQVDLPPAYRKAYDQMEQDMLAELPGGEELSVMSVLAQLTRLQQLASAAAEITVTTEVVEEDGLQVERPHVQVRLTAPSWKVDALLEVLAERPGEPVVVFAPSKQLIVLAGQMAAAKGLQVGYVVGGQSMKDRTDTVDAFQRGKLDLLCVTTGAGGVGLTLTAAKTVVFLQRPWSLVEAAQAEDRCHRIGSEIHDAIEIVDVVATKTIDTRIRAVLHEKAGQLADLLNDRRIVTQLLGGSSLRKAS